MALLGQQDQATSQRTPLMTLDDMGEGGAPVVGPLLKAIFAALDPGAPCSIGLT